MTKPDEHLLALYKLGWITGVSVDYRQTGTDTSDTYVTFANSYDNKKVMGLLSNYTKYIKLDFSYNTVATIHPEFISMVTEWEKFEQKNKRELAEYKRLQEKFGRGII